MLLSFLRFRESMHGWSLPSGPFATRTFACFVALCLAGLSPSGAQLDERPNFLFFVVDDLGWADVGELGSTFYETPHINALAHSGMTFIQAYAASPVCSPTRASILTGRHPVRVDVTDWLPGMPLSRASNPRFLQVEDGDQLALDETTMAEVLGEHGYETFFAGKWHLGGEGFLPTDQGFDVNVGGFHAGSPPGGYYAPWKNPYLRAKQDDEYLTERLTEESIDFLDARDQDQPFLLYLSYYNVHTPIEPYTKHLEHYQGKAKALFSDDTPYRREGRGMSRMRQDDPAYASMVAAVDDSVGAVLAALDARKLAENTVVFFVSDNGGLSTLGGDRRGPTSNLPLRAGKGWLYEGGIRVPMIVRAPGVTEPGSRSDTPVTSMDFFPTVLELAGLPARPELHVDGVSLARLLEGESSLPPRELVWHYPHYHGSMSTPSAAIRDGDWKLIELYEFDRVELYNLKNDPKEQRDLSEMQPEKTRRLRERLRAWQDQMHANMPQPNPSHRPQ
jgi:arylsulfatase A-like enzyme